MGHAILWMTNLAAGLLLVATAAALGAVLLIVLGTRGLGGPEPVPRASRWPWRKLAAAFGATLALYVGTFLYMDSVVRLELMSDGLRDLGDAIRRF